MRVETGVPGGKPPRVKYRRTEIPDPAATKATNVESKSGTITERADLMRNQFLSRDLNPQQTAWKEELRGLPNYKSCG